MAKAIYGSGDDWLAADGNRVLNAVPTGEDITGSLPLLYAVDSGAADVYVMAMTFGPASVVFPQGLATGLELLMKVDAGNTNTGASTLNVNSIGAKNIKMPDGTDPPAGILEAGKIVRFRYDGTNFILLEPSFGKPTFSVHRNGVDQSIPTATWTKVEWTTKVFDTYSIFDHSTNYRLTPTVPGDYLLSPEIDFSTLNDGDTAMIAIYKNGSIHKKGRVTQAVAGDGGVGVTAVVNANGTTDYFETFAWQDSGGNKNIKGASSDSFFTGCKVD